jgi:hypothetical protein
MFDCKQSREEADALSLRGLMEVAKAWQRGDLYAQLWLMLYHNGRIAPSPIEAREDAGCARCGGMRRRGSFDEQA